ncbi:hypothetical protein BC835DRAFT_1365478 [Cytidiella melzeri]|nr:hypothetical protein BC835DRAFT_1398637 [Cytidiella melzeri]KAI0690274.1 hypothetical protein BC835DRAFT_1365478 [Cytidiella melzeri]
MNAVLLTAVVSATNPCFYASFTYASCPRASRPSSQDLWFGFVNDRGVPVPALV